jgi:hypothetical protein
MKVRYPSYIKQKDDMQIVILFFVAGVQYVTTSENELKIYTSTKKIPGLENLSVTERMAILEQAGNRMTIPEKTLLNIIKLLVIVPVFALLLRVVENWWVLAWAGLVLLLYPLFVKPLQYSLSAKYIKLKKPEEDE